jgi:AcrR family transcriptional regulator
MNDFYIEYMIKAQMREEVEACRRRRLLKQEASPELRSNILKSASSAFRLFDFERTKVVHICRDLGVSRRMFQRYFRSLEKCLKSCRQGE